MSRRRDTRVLSATFSGSGSEGGYTRPGTSLGNGATNKVVAALGAAVAASGSERVGAVVVVGSGAKARVVAEKKSKSLAMVTE